MRVCPENRRITWVILAFACLSLAASLLPLIPGIQRLVPLSILDRQEAITVYACTLLGFLGFVFPLLLRPPDRDARSVAPWWFVGGFTLFFAGIPLFLLAYIAGVHVRTVFAILALATILHGLVLLFASLLRYRGRLLFVIALFAATVTVPSAAWLRDTVRGAPAVVDSLQPFVAVLSWTRDFARPPLFGLVAAAVLLQGVCLVVGVLPRRSGRVTLAVMLIGASLLVHPSAGGPVPGARGDYRLLMPSQGLFVEGASLPLAVETSAPGARVVVRVAGRETYRWTSEAAATWIYPVVVAAGETIQVEVDGARESMTIRGMESGRRLALVDRSTLPLLSTLPGSLVPCAVDAAEFPPHSQGYDPFDVVVMSASAHASLSPDCRSALRQAVRTGCVLLLTGSSREQTRRDGAGRIIESSGASIPDLPPRIRTVRGVDPNLYSNFALPDWGRVDLSPLLWFLVVYHTGFYAAFLLPLLIDAKKSLGVYLVSVGFVVVVFVIASWFGVKRIFLRDTQLLLQSLDAYVVSPPPPDGAQRAALIVEEIACFASFNGTSSPIELERNLAPRLVHEDPAQGAGDVRVDLGRERLVLENVRLDRFRRKQIVRFEATPDAPLRLIAEDGGWRIAAATGAHDELGLLTARRLGAFIRRDGRVYGVRFRGGVLVPDSDPHPLSWHGVLPEDLVRDSGIPFVRWLLGRFATTSQPVLCVLLEGVAPLHDDPRYLARRSVVQLLVFPLATP